MPDFRDYAVEVPKPGAVDGEATRVLGAFLRDVMKLNADHAEFPRLRPGRDRLEPAGARVRGDRPGVDRRAICRSDDHLAPDGRVMEILSEHTCQGWLEGYLLTGRHGFFSCYEAFIHIVDSMFNQHAKWLKITQRDPLAPADRLAQLPADLARLAAGPQRLQPSGSGLHRPRGEQEGRGRARLSAAGRQHAALGHRPLPAQPQLRQRHRRRQAAGAAVADMDAAIKHCTAGIGIWDWASNDQGGEPDVVMACAGDVPTLETLAAVEHPARARARAEDPRRQRRRPDDACSRQSEHPHGLSDREFDALFTDRQADHLRLSTAIRG